MVGEVSSGFNCRPPLVPRRFRHTPPDLIYGLKCVGRVLVIFLIDGGEVNRNSHPILRFAT